MKRHKEQIVTIYEDRKIIVLILSMVLLVSVIGNVWLGAKNFKSFGRAQEYNLLDPARKFYGKNDLIVDFQSLRDELNKMGENKNISIYFEYLPTGANIAVNKDLEIWPASLIKIPIAMAAMKKIEKSEWKLSNELVILDVDKDYKFGSLYEKPSGTPMTIESLLYESLVSSDNTAHFVLLRNLENSEIEDLYNHLGMEDILDALKKTPEKESQDNKITAKRYSIFFRSLYNASFLSLDYSQIFLEILIGNPKREYLAVSLPESVKFSHKTGIRADEKVYADSGIVYVPNRPYILTVMIQETESEQPEEKAQALMNEISKKVYEYVSQYNPS